MVDLFIFHDDLQYTKNDWRNRNKIKTKNGAVWLTIPTGTNQHRLINQVMLTNPLWQQKHWQKIVENYKSAACFKEVAPFFEQIYLQKYWTSLSALNQHIIKRICSEWLGIATKFDNAENFHLQHKKEARVIELLLKCNASEYISGPAAKSYLNHETLQEKGIALKWMDYDNYLPYPQLFPPFEHSVSIIDLLFNTGRQAKYYLKFHQLHV